MSLSIFKETLKPCTNSSSTSSTPISSNSQPNSSISHQFDSPINPRIPPKSSISQQLLRLQDPESLPQPQSQSQLKQTPVVDFDGEKEDEEEDDEKGYGFGKPKLDGFQFDHMGPYEPLVLLSSPDGTPLVQVPASINCRLLQHQREGVKFLYNLYKNNHGGVLGDDMGLGKTIQTIAFLSAVYGKDGEFDETTSLNGTLVAKNSPVLIICPSSVIHNWENEFSKWSIFNVSIYHGSNRDFIIEKLHAREVEILVTSFDTYRIQSSTLSVVEWEIVVVDEAHRLKNEKSKLYGACLEIKTRKRYGLTGTIMQNKIMELFNLFDWVSPECLGNREHFREFYDEPLKHGQRSTAPERFVRVADERKQHLVAVLQKYLLRRTKEETIGHLMMGKEDNVVFCAMSELQKRVYQRILQIPDIQCLINKDLPCSCGSPLKQVECCKRIVPNGLIWPYLHRENPEGCNWCPFCLVLPCLVKLQQISNHLELTKPNPRDDPDKQKKDAAFASAVFGTDIDLIGGNTQNQSFMGLSDVQHCGKMRALEKLMLSWISRGDKILLFSYSVRMLDILEKFLIRKGYCFSRLDGSTPTGLRQSLVDDFNASPSKQVFLISTRAGGLGLNLVSANRVVIFDPNWNPAQDLQAQDRSFRFGQKRHVIVFRLLAAGSLEELVYSRQVYKQQLSNIAVSGKMEKRYFEGVQVKGTSNMSWFASWSAGWHSIQIIPLSQIRSISLFNTFCFFSIPFASFQDCKEFPGELFGICNLFRDLSDKLFTSEIIELHEKQGKEYEQHQSAKRDLDELGMYLVPSEAVKEEVSSASETSKRNDSERNTRIKPVLKDLGIVYAHRNEDIVNYGAVTQEKKESSEPRNDRLTAGRRKKDGVGGKENASSLKTRKKSQYSQLAESMGMEEVEFSKWLLSASPAGREKVLREYKRSKKDKLPPYG